MKRILIWAFFCSVATMVLCSCNDDPVVNGEDFDKELIDFPTEDIVKESIDRTIYLIGTISSNNERQIIDNFSSRFAARKVLEASSLLHPGDAIVFESEILGDIIAGNDYRLNMLKEAYGQGVVIMMNGGSTDDFSKLCTALDCYNPYKKSKEPVSNNESTPLWIMAGKMPGLGGLYCCLSPSINWESEDKIVRNIDGGETNVSMPINFTEYEQGLLCEQILKGIKKGMLVPNSDKSPTSELTELMSAIKIYVDGKQTGWIKKKKKKVYLTNFYLAELDIWNAYSESENRQFYYIHQELTLPFQNLLLGECHEAAWKSYGFYGKKLETTFKNEGAQNGVVFHKLSPNTTQESKTYTTSVQYNVGGSISTSSASLNAGMTITHSSSYTVDDVVISNKGVAASQESQAAWAFDLREATGKYHAFYHGNTAITPGSLSGRETFISGADYIFSVPQGHNNIWKFDYTVSLRWSSFYTFGSTKSQHEDYTKTFSKTFSLPVVKEK